MAAVSVARNPYFAPAQGVAQSTTFNQLAKGWIGYAQNGADQTGISGAGSYDITDATVTCTVHTNRLIKVSGSATFTVTSASAKFSLDCVEGGTTLARLGEFSADNATNGFITAGGVIQLSGFTWQIAPTNGSHTYKLQVTIISGSGTLAVAGTNPAEASIFVEDMGAAS